MEAFEEQQPLCDSTPSAMMPPEEQHLSHFANQVIFTQYSTVVTADDGNTSLSAAAEQHSDKKKIQRPVQKKCSVGRASELIGEGDLLVSLADLDHARELFLHAGLARSSCTAS